MTDLEKAQDQLELALKEIKSIKGRNVKLLYDYVFEAHRLVKKLTIPHVSGSLLDEENTDDPILDMALDITFYKHGEDKNNTPEFNKTLGKVYDFINELVGNDR